MNLSQQEERTQTPPGGEKIFALIGGHICEPEAALARRSQGGMCGEAEEANCFKDLIKLGIMGRWITAYHNYQTRATGALRTMGYKVLLRFDFLDITSKFALQQKENWI